MSKLARLAPPCPICGAPQDAAQRPFCSRRCADIDLHRWFSGRYAVPGREDDEADDDAAPPAVGPETGEKED